MVQFALTALRFEDIRQGVVNWLKENGQYKAEFDFNGSNFSYFIDTMAYTSMLDGFNSTLTANNIFLDTTEIRNSAVSIAKRMGYIPSRKVSSKFVGTLEYVASEGHRFVPGDTIIIPAKTKFVSSPNNYVFQNMLPIRLTYENDVMLSSDFILTEGIHKNFQVFGSGKKLQSIRINSLNVEENNLNVYVRPLNTGKESNKMWERIDTFLSTRNEEIYFVEESITNEGMPKIIFGDGKMGKIPKTTEIIEVEYLETLGAAGNNQVAINFLNPPVVTISVADSTFTYSFSNFNIIDVQNSYGGSDLETLEEIQFNAPRFHGSAGGAVGVQGYAALLDKYFSSDLKYHNVSTGNIIFPNDSSVHGATFISAVPASLDETNFDGNNVFYLSEINENSIIKFMEDRTVVSTKKRFLKPSYTYIELEPFIEVPQSFTIAEKQKAISNATNKINSFIESNLRGLGKGYRHSKLTSDMISAIGVVGGRIEPKYNFSINKDSFYDNRENRIYLPIIYVKDIDGNILYDKNNLPQTKAFIKKRSEIIVSENKSKDFGAKNRTNIVAISDTNGSLNNTYFNIYATDVLQNETHYYVWFNVNSTGVNPNIINAIGIQVNIALNSSSEAVATAIESSLKNYLNGDVFTVDRKVNVLLIENKNTGEVNSISDGHGQKILSNVIFGIGDDGSTFSNITTSANNDIFNDVILIYNSPSAANDDLIYFGNDEIFSGISIDISIPNKKDVKIKYQYWNGSAWADLQNVIDSTTTGLRAFDIVGIHDIVYSIPLDWVKNSVNASNKYWIRAVTSYVGGAGYGIQPLASRIWLLTEQRTGFSLQTTTLGRTSNIYDQYTLPVEKSSMYGKLTHPNLDRYIYNIDISKFDFIKFQMIGPSKDILDFQTTKFMDQNEIEYIPNLVQSNTNEWQVQLNGRTVAKLIQNTPLVFSLTNIDDIYLRSIGVIAKYGETLLLKIDSITEIDEFNNQVENYIISLLLNNNVFSDVRFYGKTKLFDAQFDTATFKWSFQTIKQLKDDDGNDVVINTANADSIDENFVKVTDSDGDSIILSMQHFNGVYSLNNYVSETLKKYNMKNDLVLQQNFSIEQDVAKLVYNLSSFSDVDENNVQTITLNAKQTSVIKCIANVNGILNNSYFFLNTEGDNTQYYVWFNSSTKGVNPSIAGKTAIEIHINDGDTDVNVAVALQTVLSAPPYNTNFSIDSDGAYVTIQNLLDGPSSDTSDGVKKVVNSSSVLRYATTYTNYTTEANNTTIDDVLLLTDTPVVDDSIIIGHSAIFAGVEFDISTPFFLTPGGTFNLVWEYWNGSWVALSNIINNTLGTYSFDKSGVNTVEWQVPSGWTTTTIDGVGPLYYIRARIDNFSGSGYVKPKATTVKIVTGRKTNFIIDNTIRGESNINDINLIGKNDLIKISNSDSPNNNGIFLVESVDANSGTVTIYNINGVLDISGNGFIQHYKLKTGKYGSFTVYGFDMFHDVSLGTLNYDNGYIIFKDDIKGLIDNTANKTIVKKLKELFDNYSLTTNKIDHIEIRPIDVVSSKGTALGIQTDFDTGFNQSIQLNVSNVTIQD